MFFADHLAHSLQVDHIMRVVERSTLPVIRTCLPQRELPAVPEMPDWATPVPARRSGYVQFVHVEQLLASRPRQSGSTWAAAAGRGARGGRHAAGMGVAGRRRQRPAPPPDSARPRPLDAAVRIGFERTLEQDPGFGLRQLVDAACKALSPAVNDPYTAIQAIEHLSVLLLPRSPAARSGIAPRTCRARSQWPSPARSFAGHLALGVGLIRALRGERADGRADPAAPVELLRGCHG